MAQLLDQVLGNPSGLIGTLVFRVRKGASFISRKPSHRSSSPDPKEVALRSKFGLGVKVAAGINSIKVLKDCWPKATGRASKCNQIFQANYKLINTVANLGSVAVAPKFGFNVLNSVLTAGISGIHLVTDALGVNIGVDTGIEKYCVVAGVVVLQTPILGGIDPFEVIAFNSIQHNLDLINPVDMSAEFMGGPLSMYNSYTDRKVFACIVTLDENGKAIRYSNTINS
jgi:hypothetical protein